MLRAAILLCCLVGLSVQQCKSGITQAVGTNGTCPAGFAQTNGVCCKILCEDIISKYSSFSACATFAGLGYCTNSVFEEMMARRCMKTCKKCE